MIRQQPVVVVGSTARYLAQSARRCGFDVYAVDMFGDRDLRTAAAHNGHATGCTPTEVANAAVALCEQAAIQPAGMVYGAGFEGAPRVLSKLATLFPLHGNRPAVLRWLRAPTRLFPLLDQLRIPYPRVLMQAPRRPEHWLQKNSTSFGGTGISTACNVQMVSRDTYFQHYVPGKVYSVTFAANGKAARLIGFNELLAVSPQAGDFRYAGAVSNACLGSEQTNVVAGWVDRLTTRLKLRGINGLDFVLDNGQPLMLELNARPTATLELYDQQLEAGGFMSHWLACNGELPTLVGSEVVHATAVLYGSEDMTIGGIEWPSWTADRPVAGTRIRASEPLCSVHVATRDRAAVTGLLHVRCADIRARISQSARDAA